MRMGENFGEITFHGVGSYGIPEIDPVTTYPQGEFIPINYAKTIKNRKTRFCTVL